MIRGMTTPTAGPARLGWFVEQRRTGLRLSQTKAAKLAGISRPVWANVETGVGTSYGTTYAAVEAALSWEPGSCQKTLDGGEPVVLAEPAETEPAAETAALPLTPELERLERILRDPETPTDVKERIKVMLAAAAGLAEGATKRPTS